MGARRAQSRKRSAANSGALPDPPVFYLDQNFGRHRIADALRAAGHVVEIHDDHLSIDAPDEDWIELVARRRWIALTKDKNIRYRSAELAAVREHGARVVVWRAKNATEPASPLGGPVRVNDICSQGTGRERQRDVHGIVREMRIRLEDLSLRLPGVQLLEYQLNGHSRALEDGLAGEDGRIRYDLRMS